MLVWIFQLHALTNLCSIFITCYIFRITVRRLYGEIKIKKINVFNWGVWNVSVSSAAHQIGYDITLFLINNVFFVF